MRSLASRAATVLRAVAAGIAVLIPSSGRAQYLTRPHIAWETIETASFRFHYPAEMRAWVLPVAQRMESYATAVNAMVGSTPAARTTVMVEDPSNVSNGFALPFLEGPVIFLWPTPPAPSPSFGHHRGWGEVLGVHEYAHIAHLTFAPRSRGEHLLWKLAPTRIGPVARKAPAWVIEGYATYIEGKLTGNGRPNSAGRASVLRQWALEGRLPTYRELDATGSYLGGSMRYLVGSAFLEWLAGRKGEESLNHLWRRMSARQRRSFAEAFRGVWGASPDELYGAFYTEVMSRAIDGRRQLQSAGLVEGTLVQRLAWSTGEPALSRDGRRVAVVLRSADRPSRLVVWRTADEPLDSGVVRARQRLIERDPLDVAPFDSFPPPKRAVKTLYPSAGRPYDFPRWFADGERILVSRDAPLGDGATRPDLFIWNVARGGTRRVTHGAGIRTADPAPDGRSAAAVRCAAGTCDLVRVDLGSGRWTTLVAGSPFVVWHRPRWSPDGTQIAASVQREGRWGVVVIDAATGGTHPIDPGDGASRYSPSWTPDGKLVVVSERGGVPNLELLEPSTATPSAITRTVGAVAAPDVAADGMVWFLSLHARGYDVRRISSDAPASVATASLLDPALFPVAPRPLTRADTFASRPVRGPTDFGTGPRGWRVLPGATLGPDGDMVSLMLANMDPVGRLNVVAQGGYGKRGAWRGASIAAAMRGSPIEITGSAWYTDHAPSDQVAATFASRDIDSRFTAGALVASFGRDYGSWGYSLRAGGSLGRLDGNQLDGAGRTMAFSELRARRAWTIKGFGISPQLHAMGAQGGTGGDSWGRTIITGALSLGGSRRSVRAEATVGRVTSAGPGEAGRAFEQFAVGGTAPPFFDGAVLSQRLSLPSVPVGYVSGRRLELYRVSLPLLGVRPYAIWVAAGDSRTRFKRVLGAERTFEVVPIGFARVPGSRVRAGIGYSLDEPYDEKMRAYLSVTFRP